MIEQYIPTEHPFICTKHKHLEIVVPLSPARYKCGNCNKKKVNGYSNPDHVCNPFGYLYLAPTICLQCSKKKKICMWC